MLRVDGGSGGRGGGYDMEHLETSFYIFLSSGLGSGGAEVSVSCTALRKNSQPCASRKEANSVKSSCRVLARWTSDVFLSSPF